MARRPDDTTPTETQLFLDDVFARLAAGGFGTAAWSAFWRSAWHRAGSLRREEPGRTRSFALWGALGLLLGAGTLGAAAAGGATWVGLGWITLCLAWYSLVCAWTWLHLGRARREDGSHRRRFLAANGLSFLRLGLAPLAAAPIALGGPSASLSTRAILAGLLALLVLSDLLDGWLARHRDQHTALGRVLDPMADLALLGFLAWGLWSAGLLPWPLLLLMLLRYPGAMALAVALYVLRGPRHITATALGKVTTATSFTLLCLVAHMALLRPPYPTTAHVRWALWGMGLLLAANMAYLLRRARSWHAERPSA